VGGLVFTQIVPARTIWKVGATSPAGPYCSVIPGTNSATPRPGHSNAAHPSPEQERLLPLKPAVFIVVLHSGDERFESAESQQDLA
jgi:hypothetical protein